MKHTFAATGQALCLVFALAATPVVAREAPKPVAQHNSNAVWFENWIGLSNAGMKIVAPNGKITEIFAESGTPVFRLEQKDVMDGVYSYSISAATEEREEIVNKIDNGRGDAASDTVAKSFHLSGYFTVSRGVIVTPEDIKEE